MLQFAPIYKAAPWGGRGLTQEFGRSLPEGPIGESWELSEIDGKVSVVAQGPREGATLGELWRAGVLGGSARGKFPFLLKWLSTEGNLSVQVHPDAAICKKLGLGAPKTEAWLVCARAPQARMYVGHYPGLDPATLRLAATTGSVHKWLYEIHPKPSEMMLIPAGTLHAIGPGYLVLEVQQPSDTTFRVYDWGRVGADGHARPLNLDEACVAVDYDRPGAPKVEREAVHGPTFSMRKIRHGETFAAERLRAFVADLEPATLSFAGGSAILEPGEVRVAEAADGEITLAKGRAVLVSEADPPV